MDKFNVKENWLNTVAYSHSGSKQTRAAYETQFQKFLDFVEKTPEQIVKEYERSSDRKFKRTYAQYLMALIGELQKRDYSPSSISGMANTVRSFFKYNDLPLGFIPSASHLIQFHNRDIEKNEVLEVLRLCNLRDRAFLCMLAQSGLRPGTIAKLRVKDVEKILFHDTPVPCKITVKQENTKGAYGEYFSFMGEESVSYLKDYLKTKSKVLTDDDYLFSKFGKEHEMKPLDPGILTHIFERIVNGLRAKNVLSFKTSTKKMSIETKTHEPLRNHISRSELRLYNLRKYFRKYAGQAGHDYVNFWMGHTSSLGVDLHYFSKDAEHHRKIYQDKAMPHLRLETATASESQTAINELTQRLTQKDIEIKELKEKIAAKEAKDREQEKRLAQMEEWKEIIQKTITEKELIELQWKRMHLEYAEQTEKNRKEET
jgi:integrase